MVWGRGRVVGLLLICCVIGGVAVAAVSWYRLAHDRPAPTTFGTPAGVTSPAPKVAAPASSTSETSTPAPTPTPSATATGPFGSTSVSPPARISIPTLNIRAEVEQVATTDGELGVPENPAHVGWWIGGAMPGTPTGSVVIDGHVDSAATGPGALFAIKNLVGGDRVLITTAGGATLTYTVTAREVLTKTDGLPPRLFATSGPARLVLITCGGPFDSAARSYLDNIVVYATPTTSG